MDILVAILIIVVIAAVAFAVIQRRRGPARIPGAQRPRGSAIGRPGGGVGRGDPMADAVAEHARATDPADVVAAEQRMQAQARQVSAGMQGGAAAPYATDGNGHAGMSAGQASGAAMPDPTLGGAIDPATGARTDGYGDETNDPRYGDSRYDGRLAADYDPHPDEQR